MGNKIDLYIYAICRLLEMDLSNTRITSPCVAHLLPDMRHLTSLGLQGILLNDDDLIFLTHLSGLKKIILSDTGSVTVT